MKMVKCLPEFDCFTVFLKNRNFISKIRISKVTDYATLNAGLLFTATFSFGIIFFKKYVFLEYK